MHAWYIALNPQDGWAWDEHVEFQDSSRFLKALYKFPIPKSASDLVSVLMVQYRPCVSTQ